MPLKQYRPSHNATVIPPPRLGHCQSPATATIHNNLILDVAFKRATLILIHVAAVLTSLVHLFKSPQNGRPVYFNNRRAGRRGDRTVSHNNIFLLCHCCYSNKGLGRYFNDRGLLTSVMWAEVRGKGRARRELSSWWTGDVVKLSLTRA